MGGKLTSGGAQKRQRLSKEKVIEAAVALADGTDKGVPSMRQLAKQLDIEAMSLYHHFRHKDLLLDGMIDEVFSEIELPSKEAVWPVAMRRRADSMREVLKRHPWALNLMNSRATPGYETLRHHDAVLGCLREGGFSVAGAAHAIAILDSYIYGFLLQELSLPFSSATDLETVAGSIVEHLSGDEFPYLTEMITSQGLEPGYSFAAEFEIGLDLILGGLKDRLKAQQWK